MRIVKDHKKRKFLTQALGVSIATILVSLPEREARSVLPLALRLIIAPLKKRLIEAGQQARGFATGVTVEEAGAHLVSDQNWEYVTRGLAGVSAYAVTREIADSIDEHNARALLVQRDVENRITVLLHNPSHRHVRDYIHVTLDDTTTGHLDWLYPETILIDVGPQEYVIQELSITNVLTPGVKRLRAESVDGVVVSPRSDNLVVATKSQLLIGETL